MKKKVKQVSPARGWAFTLNNYTEDEYSSIVQQFQEVGDNFYWGVGKEIGKEGTPHLQGWCYAMTAKKWRPLPRYSVKRDGVECSHWSKFTKCMLANHRYCKKESSYISNYSEEVVEFDMEAASQRECDWNRTFGCKICSIEAQRKNEMRCCCPRDEYGRNLRSPFFKRLTERIEREVDAEFTIYDWMLKYCYKKC